MLKVFDLIFWYEAYKTNLTLSRLRPISYTNQSIDLQSKSMDWFYMISASDVNGLNNEFQPIDNKCY